MFISHEKDGNREYCTTTNVKLEWDILMLSFFSFKRIVSNSFNLLWYFHCIGQKGRFSVDWRAWQETVFSITVIGRWVCLSVSCVISAVSFVAFKWLLNPLLSSTTLIYQGNLWYVSGCWSLWAFAHIVKFVLICRVLTSVLHWKC